MSFADDMANDSSLLDHRKNFSALQSLESEGHKVEAKGTAAVYVDDYLMIFLYANLFENHKTNVRGEFIPGEIKELL